MDLVKDRTGRQEQIKTIVIKYLLRDNWIHSMYEVVVEGPEVDLLEKNKKGKK